MSLWQRLKTMLPSWRRAQEKEMSEELQSLAAIAEPGELGNLTRAAEEARATWGCTRVEQTDTGCALRPTDDGQESVVCVDGCIIARHFHRSEHRNIQSGRRFASKIVAGNQSTGDGFSRH